MKRYAVIADDFTGAGDSGVHFAAAGLRTALVLDNAKAGETLRDHDAVALSTESRFLPPATAAERVRDAVSACRAAGVDAFFKKIDSTLRGNLEAETAAALEAGDFDAALLCSAMPKTGRVIRDGMLYVHGVPVSETELGRDPFNPVPTSVIADLLPATRCAPLPLAVVRGGQEKAWEAVCRFADDGCRVIIAEAETDADLAVLGEVLRSEEGGGPRLLPVGAGGLAEAFVASSAKTVNPAASGRLLAIVGSLTATSREQVNHAAERGLFAVAELNMEEAFARPDAVVERLLADVREAGDKHILITSVLPVRANRSEDDSREDGLRAAAVFGRVARALCFSTGCRRLYVTGGSTAVAVASALGIGSVTLERELFPGVVQSGCDCEFAPLRWFITKAGGFGGPDLLTRLAGNEK